MSELMRIDHRLYRILERILDMSIDNTKLSAQLSDLDTKVDQLIALVGDHSSSGAEDQATIDSDADKAASIAAKIDAVLAPSQPAA